MSKCECGKEGFHKMSCSTQKVTVFIPTLEGSEAEEFNRKADENYEKYKARQKQNLIDMMEADEKLGLYEKPQPTEDVEALALKEYPSYIGNATVMVIIDEFNDVQEIARAAFTKGYQLAKKFLETEQATKQVVKDSLTTQTVEKWEDFELYDVFETAIQESALTVVTKYHNLDEETTELALECVRIFKELKGTTDQGLREAAENVVAWERSTNNLMKLIGLLDELEKSLKATN